MMKSLRNFYRKRYNGKLFIIKAGGRVITDFKSRTNLLKAIRELNDDGIKVLLIFGGGHAIDDGLAEAGLESVKINGRRITSGKDIEVVKKVMAGDLASRVSESLAELKMDGYVMNTLPAGWVLAKRKPKKNRIVRFDGDITHVEKKNIKNFFQNVKLAICPCLTLCDEGFAVNVNADNVAVALAIGIKAAKLIFLTDVDGVKIHGDVASVLTAYDLENYIEEGVITGGMQVKMENCIEAVRSGVNRVHILNGFEEGALQREVYTSKGTGTMILRRREKKIYEFELSTNKKKRKTA